ncbi:hypothetical protein [Ponticaulis sp.]|uniref:hypothetical protein n=1 Tax=Ponticaulis sp. TaxID=2020902 RepID=UPI000B6B0D0B|nr:hypothetical protein [Ponticaulis sp.]MAI90463.1 hypothetical protein [Ponticaulis sp.]OUY00160.1 MAG: hypothetical protein CBB65_08490 [Hyphomonadaceae bacterium TMED5]|tara:strand:+ start:80145 stop:80333 length:189 start_codon:yes stop_codon:yes gene_type:complete
MESDWNARGDMAQTERLREWLESQNSVLSFWMDRLVEDGNADMLTRLEGHQRELEGLLGQLS